MRGTFISAGPVAGLASGKTGAGGPGLGRCGSVPGGGAAHESLLLWLRSAGFGGSAASVGCLSGLGVLVWGCGLDCLTCRSEIITQEARWRSGLDWYILAEELRFLSVILPEPSTRVMYWSNCFTCMMTPGLVPPRWVGSGLVLDSDVVPYSQGREPFGVLSPPLRCLHVAVSQGFFPQGEGVTPCWVWGVALRDDRYEILDRSSEDTLCRGQPGVWIGGVTVLQDGLLECVGVKGALWVCVIRDEPLDCFHPYVSPAVGMFFSLYFLIAEATSDSPWTSGGAGCSIYFSTNSMRALDIWFFMEVKLLFECFLHLSFGDIPGFRFFPNAVYSNIIPPTLILQIFDLIGVIIKGTAHLFDLFFDFM